MATPKTPTTAEVEQVLRGSLLLPALIFLTLAGLILVQIYATFTIERRLLILDENLSLCAQAQVTCWGASPEELKIQLQPRLQALRNAPTDPALFAELEHQLQLSPLRPDQIMQGLQGIRLDLQGQRQRESLALQKSLVQLVLGGVLAGLAPLAALLRWQRRKLGGVLQTYAGLNASLIRAVERNSQLAQNLQNAQENERRRLARELHDDLGQVFTSLKMDLDWLQRQPAGSPEMTSRLAEMRDLNQSAVESIRRIVNELRPAILDDLGLAAAIEWLTQDLAARGQFQVHLRWPDQPLPGPIESVLFRLVQEGLHNVTKHARAQQVWLQLRLSRKRIYLRLADDGKGLGDSPPKGQGALGVQERAEILGGWAGYRVRRHGGAVLLAILPKPEPTCAI